MMDKVATYRVENAPPTIYYIPEFITKDEEEYLLRQVYAAPKPKWTQLLNRRLQNWGGLPHQKGMIPEPIPDWLKKYCTKISDLGAFGSKKANHILVNEYQPGEGIMPHLDGDLYYPTVSTISLGSHTLLNFYRPLTDEGEDGDHASVSEGECPQMAAHHPSAAFAARHVTSLLLEARSLVLVQDDMHSTYLHGISEVPTDTPNPATVANLDRCRTVHEGQTLERTTRVSLTIRHVPKVLSVKLPFGRR